MNVDLSFSSSTTLFILQLIHIDITQYPGWLFPGTLQKPKSMVLNPLYKNGTVFAFNLHIGLCACTQSLSRVRLFATPWTVARQASVSMSFPRQEYCSGLPFPPPGHLPDPRIEPASLLSLALAGGYFTTWVTWEAQPMHTFPYTLNNF